MNTPSNERELVASNNYVTDAQIARMGWHPITQVPAIFFAKVGAAVMLNRKRLVSMPFLLDNNTMAFSMDQKLLDSEFGQSLFERLDLTSLIQVGTLPSYNASDVEEMLVSLPSSMDEQGQIGHLFTRLDNLITLHQREGLIRSSNTPRLFTCDKSHLLEIKRGRCIIVVTVIKLPLRIGGNMDTKELGRRIQDLLNLKGISRKEFAEMTGFTEAAICRYINGQREPKAITLSIIANSLGVSVDDLLGTKGGDQPSLDEAVLLVARSANGLTAEQKRKLLDAIAGI